MRRYLKVGDYKFKPERSNFMTTYSFLLRNPTRGLSLESNGRNEQLGNF
jgi:hypothetical protein